MHSSSSTLPSIHWESCFRWSRNNSCSWCFETEFLILKHRLAIHHVEEWRYFLDLFSSTALYDMIWLDWILIVSHSSTVLLLLLTQLIRWACKFESFGDRFGSTGRARLDNDEGLSERQGRGNPTFSSWDGAALVEIRRCSPWDQVTPLGSVLAAGRARKSDILKSTRGRGCRGCQSFDWLPVSQRCNLAPQKPLANDRIPFRIFGAAILPWHDLCLPWISMLQAANYACSQGQLSSLELASSLHTLDFKPWQTKYQVHIDTSFKQVVTWHAEPRFVAVGFEFQISSDLAPSSPIAPSILSLLVTYIIINIRIHLNHCYIYIYIDMIQRNMTRNRKALAGGLPLSTTGFGCRRRFEALAARADVRSTKWISIEQPAAPSGDDGNEQHLIEAGHGTDMADSIVFL